MKLTRTIAYRPHTCSKCGVTIKSKEIIFFTGSGGTQRYFCERQGELMIETSVVTRVIDNKSIKKRNI